MSMKPVFPRFAAVVIVFITSFATTSIAEGKVQVARAKGTSLPLGVLLAFVGVPFFLIIARRPVNL